MANSFDDWLESKSLLDYYDRTTQDEDLDKFPLVSSLGISPEEADNTLFKKGRGSFVALDDYVCVDLETSDRNPRWAEIVEIGAVRVSGGKVVGEFCSLANPGVPCEAGAEDVHHITQDMIDQAPPVCDVLRDFLLFLGDSPIVGHNLATFDSSVLYHSCVRHLGRIFPNNYVDTMYLARRHFADKRSLRLADVLGYFEIKNDNAHRALSDVYATVELYEKLKAYIYADDDVLPPAPAFGGYDPETILSSIRDMVGDDDNVILRKNKNNTAIYMFNAVAFRIVVNSRSRCLTTKWDDAEEFLADIEGAESTASGYRIPIGGRASSVPAVRQLVRAVYDAIQAYKDPAVEMFGCCDLFTACSDAKRCLRADDPDMRGCYYRRNLEAGRIFYGKNKNYPPEDQQEKGERDA